MNLKNYKIKNYLDHPHPNISAKITELMKSKIKIQPEIS